jgi:hypothetical protein
MKSAGDFAQAFKRNATVVVWLMSLAICLTFSMGKEYGALAVAPWGALVAVGISWQVLGAKVDIWGKLLVFYAVVLGVYGAFSSFAWSGVHLAVSEALRSSSMTSVVCLMGVIGVLNVLELFNLIGQVAKILGAFGLIVSIATLIAFLCGGDVTRQVPLFDNPSMACAFSVMTLPLLLAGIKSQRISWALIAVVGLSVIVTKATAPLLALLAVLYLLYTELRGPIVVSGVFYLWSQHWHLSTSGRTEIWVIALHKWISADWAAYLFGFGPGTIENLLPAWSGPRGSWLNMHNEWLQIPIELGIIGAILLNMSLLTRLKESRCRVHSQAAFVGVAVLAVAEPLFRWPLHAFAAGVIYTTSFASVQLSGWVWGARKQTIKGESVPDLHHTFPNRMR